MLDKLVEALLQFVDLFKLVRVVQPYERGLVVRVGGVVREVGPGWYWVWPLAIDHVLTCTMSLDTERLEAQSLTTLDGHSVTVKAVITYRVVDIHKALIEVQGAKETLADTAYGEIKAHVAKTVLAELSAKALETRIAKSVRDLSAPFGLDIVRVRFSDCAQMKSLRLVSG